MRRTHKTALFVVALLIVGTGLYLGLFGDLPAPDALLTRSLPDSTKILDRNGRLLYEVLDPRAGNRTHLPLAAIPLHLRHAVVAVEDAGFYTHPGVDLVGVGRALAQLVAERRIVSGGSTITQQLARDVLLSKEERESRTITRKLREMVLALRLTQAYSKDSILEMYLNEVYLGQLAYGVEAAAHAYFGKPAHDLDLAESALLAGLIQSPSAYNPLVNLDAARARQKVVLGLMVKNGYVSESDADQAALEPLHFPVQMTDGRTLDAQSIRAPHFVSYVRNLLEELYGPEMVNHGGLRVVTTLDLNWQERAQAIVRQKLDELARRTREEYAPDYNMHDAALVALDPATGEILAMVGSADYFNASIDGAVNVALSNRQPGSAIKPITYATAFGQGLTAATVMNDVPTTFMTRENQPYQPQNYDLTWHGPISLRRALATSSNLIAVQVLDHVGLAPMIETARSLGITTFADSDRFGLSLTLGGGEVKLLELTAAYAAFANEGRPVYPRAILSVNGQPVGGGDASSATRGLAGISPQVAYLITDILSDNQARINAFGEDNLLELSQRAAAKTGTTSDFRDNWTLGYTSNLAVGVWAGNANNDPMYKISGITGAAPIWHDFMEEALRERPPKAFVRPEGLVEAEVCDASGLRPTDLCPRRRTELFIAGTEPVSNDDSYRAVTLDSATHLVWAEGCQGPRITSVFRVLPPEAQEWGRKQGIPDLPQQDCLGRAANAAWDSPGVRAAQGSPGPALIITNPPRNATFALSPQLPPDMQRIEIGVRLGGTARLRQVTLWIDGRAAVTFDQAPYRLLWRLEPGDHTVSATALDETGRQIMGDSLPFRVETGE